jgi:type IX secretion system PorP/SprF family membrane protein
MYNKIKFVVALFFITLNTFSQEGIPVYSDYLSDNYYLIFPSMAGASNCHKVRLTARNQWFGQSEAPALQTLSYNGRVSEKSGVGAIVFNDVNGYHSQFGFKATYAHHIMFSRDEIDLNQLSFGVNVGVNQSQLDETEFQNSGDYDPILGNVVESASYFNMDIGASYKLFDFSFNAVVKNVLESRRNIYTEYESDNLRKFIVSGGYVFGNADKILWEPSLLYQFVDKTKESALDINMKAYKNLSFGSLWAVLSYRRSFDGAEYSSGSGTNSQKLQYITPVLGFNYKNFMFAYTYSYLLGDIQYDTAGLHQLTLGLNLFCKPVKYSCNCPAIN